MEPWIGVNWAAKSVRLATLGLSFLALNNATAAACTPPVSFDTATHSAFASALVYALSEFERANKQADELGNATNGTDMLAALDVASEHLACASQSVNAFKTSPYAGEGNAAKVLQAVASELTSANEASKQGIVATLNGDLANEKAGDHAARMAKLAGQYRNSWELLPQATVMALLSLVEFESPATKKKGRLGITRLERDKLNAELLAAFPRAKEGGDGMTQPEVAAAIIYADFNRQGWALHDEPFPERR